MSTFIARVIAMGQLFGSVETRNMFEYGTDSVTSLSDPDAQSLVDQVIAILQTVQNVTISTFQYYGFEVHYWSEGHWQPYKRYPVSIVGAGSATSATFQNAGLITAGTQWLRTRARKFIPGLAVTSAINGAWQISVLNAMANYLVLWLSPVTGEQGVWYPGVKRKDGVFAPITGGLVGNIISTMRRRKPGYGI